MADTEPNWEWYRSFVSVLDTGSLSAAGRAMGLTQPTVGRHIDSLEAALGLRLFTRSFDGFSPTDAALELRPYAESLATTAAALRRVASSHGDGVRGTVRLTASEVVAVEVLPPILAALRRAHPALVVELVLSNAVDDLLRREADIAVRMVPPTQDALVARRVGRIELGLHAHERYLAEHGTPRTMAQLKRHTLIGFDTESPLARKLQARWPALARDAFGLRTDSDLAHLAALRAGFGVGVSQTALGRRYGLTHVMPNVVPWRMTTWVVMHENLKASRRMRLMFDHLVAGLSDYVAEGRKG